MLVPRAILFQIAALTELFVDHLAKLRKALSQGRPDDHDVARSINLLHQLSNQIIGLYKDLILCTKLKTPAQPRARRPRMLLGQNLQNSGSTPKK